ncbi:hypothetical protein [Leptospira idonii]|uniref:Uncharacterized protein n=1 Tax=Leptospira idonii TaxID=1193500 RepID=A0A4R9LY33_9LEPT|nr:hypothetical protein [Leptospira idonii]TGN17351.1 hypothetical protein EHS15_17610 [Leptospira idonii]
MKHNRISLYASITLLFIFSSIYSQKGVKGGDYQQVPSYTGPTNGQQAPVYQEPNGGFSKSIAGRWNCGDLGTMVLKQNGKKITGTYTNNGGTVAGTISDNYVSGNWTENDGSYGEFEWQVSIERKSPKPTHLRGHWKNHDEADWEDEWVCTDR